MKFVIKQHYSLNKMKGRIWVRFRWRGEKWLSLSFKASQVVGFFP
jgi:hypothetical protein